LLFVATLFLIVSAQDPPCGFRNYDQFMKFEWLPSPNVTNFTTLETSALLVIDMQKDFTFGSFVLPCFNDTKKPL